MTRARRSRSRSRRGQRATTGIRKKLDELTREELVQVVMSMDSQHQKEVDVLTAKLHEQTVLNQFNKEKSRRTSRAMKAGYLSRNLGLFVKGSVAPNRSSKTAQGISPPSIVPGQSSSGTIKIEQTVKVMAAGKLTASRPGIEPSSKLVMNRTTRFFPKIQIEVNQGQPST